MVGASSTAVPVLRLCEVYRLGALAPKTAPLSCSLEGHCLSVSVTPHAWEAIARLGGQPLWRLSRAQGMFLDVHSALECRELMDTVLRWARTEELIRPQRRWRAWYIDEAEQWRYMLCADEGAAYAELEGCERIERGSPNENTPNGVGALVEPVVIWGGTAALGERIGYAHVGDWDAREYALQAWTEQRAMAGPLADLDGLWWDELYDPPALSAPRGGIFPHCRQRWQAASLSLADIDDDELLCSVPTTAWVCARPPQATSPTP